MKHFPVSVIAALALGYAGAGFAETRFVATDDSVETRLCISAATDERHTFMQRIDDANLSVRTVARSLYCNGQPVGHFARMAQNEAVFLRLRHYTPGFVEIKEVKDLALSSPGLSSPDIAQIIRVQGAR